LVGAALAGCFDPEPPDEDEPDDDSEDPDPEPESESDPDDEAAGFFDSDDDPRSPEDFERLSVL
jgi:hypothetical protein